MAKTQAKDSGVRYTKEDRKRAKQMARKGHSVPEIEAVLNGPSRTTIRTWLEGDNIAPASGRKRRFDRAQILKDLRAKNVGKPKFTRAQICEKYGCSSKFVSQLANGELNP